MDASVKRGNTMTAPDEHDEAMRMFKYILWGELRDCIRHLAQKGQALEPEKQVGDIIGFALALVDWLETQDADLDATERTLAMVLGLIHNRAEKMLAKLEVSAAPVKDIKHLTDGVKIFARFQHPLRENVPPPPPHLR